MFNTMFAAILIVSGFRLFAHEHHELAVVNFVSGGMAAFHGLKEYARGKSVRRGYASLLSHTKEIDERVARREPPMQIAEALQRDYQIPPSRALVHLGRTTLQSINRERDPQAVQARLD